MRRPGAFDRRFREACDFYNYGLGLALTGRRSTNAVVQLESARRRLPVGEIELRLGQNELASRVSQCEQILLADQFRVRGLSVRNREAGVGAPLIAVWPTDPTLRWRRSVPATVLLRLQGSLADLAAGRSAAALELYSPLEDEGRHVMIGQAKVPLETDLTTYRAYTLNQSTIWKLGKTGFPRSGRAHSQPVDTQSTLRPRPHSRCVRPWHVFQPGHLGGDGQLAVRPTRFCANGIRSGASFTAVAIRWCSPSRTCARR